MTGSASPVSADSSRTASSPATTPSAGTISPARTETTSPGRSSSTSTSSTLPSTYRCAIRGARSTRRRSSRRARPAAHASSAAPPDIISATIAAARNSPSASAQTIATSAIASTPTSPRRSERAVEITSGTSTTTAPDGPRDVGPPLLAGQPERRPATIEPERDRRQPSVAKLPHLLREEGGVVDRYQLFASVRTVRPRDPDPRVDDDGAVGQADHRVEVELGELGEVVGELREPVQHVGERGGVGGRGAAEPGDEPPGLARGDELVGVDVGQRRQPEVGVADQLGEHAAGAEGDERAEDGILGDAREELDAALDHRLDDHRAADPLRGRPDRRPRSARSSATPPDSVLCAPAAAVLTTTG